MAMGADILACSAVGAIGVASGVLAETDIPTGFVEYGGFGLLALIVVAALRYLPRLVDGICDIGPSLKAAIKESDERHGEAMEKMSSQHREDMERKESQHRADRIEDRASIKDLTNAIRELKK